MNTAPEQREQRSLANVAEQSGIDQALNILILGEAIADAEMYARELKRAEIVPSFRS